MDLRLSFNESTMRSSATSILLSLTLGSTLLVPRSASAAEPACAHPAVSRFWQRTEALCTRARALKAEREAQPTPAPAEAPPDGAAAPEQPAPIPLPPFCATPGTLPDFASGSLADREAALTAAAAATGVPPEALGELKEQAPVVAALWLDELASRLAPESTFQTGAGADLLVSELVGAVCKQGARPWLEATCSPFGSEPALLELRKRLLLDVMKLPARAATVNQALAAEERLRATVALALLDAATSASGPYELAASLARLTAPAEVEQWCSASDAAAPKDDAAIASSLLLRLLADGPALDRPDSYYEAVVTHALGAARGGQAQLSAASRTALRQLLGALRALRKTSAAATPPESAELITRLERLTTVATSLLVVVRDQPFVLPPSPIKLGRAVLEADLDVALQQAL
ncbi:MAG TPA: hypothetical protein VM686_19160, partial [Polyangiaceae bacterium]|nr:hypothetical protein [Polyangiaceae bacterium]